MSLSCIPCTSDLCMTSGVGAAVLSLERTGHSPGKEEMRAAVGRMVEEQKKPLLIAHP